MMAQKTTGGRHKRDKDKRVTNKLVKELNDELKD
jgi:hypothetical protein